MQGASDDTIAATMAPSPEDPQPLTEEELQEREQLQEQGFSNWNRRDFTSFVRACERFGRHAVPEITKEVEGKTEEEVCNPCFLGLHLMRLTCEAGQLPASRHAGMCKATQRTAAGKNSANLLGTLGQTQGACVACCWPGQWQGQVHAMPASNCS